MFALQDSIEINGKLYKINTGIHEWMQFYEEIRDGSTDFRFLFPGEAPYVQIGTEWITTKKVIDELFSFYQYIKPDKDEDRRDDLLNFVIDEDLIYAAFLQQYRMDLYEENIHWHKFLKLLAAITDDTLLGRVIGYRAYEGTDKEMLRMKRLWALPVELTPEEQAAVDAFNAL